MLLKVTASVCLAQELSASPRGCMTKHLVLLCCVEPPPQDDSDARLWAIARSFSDEEWGQLQKNHLGAEKTRGLLRFVWVIALGVGCFVQGGGMADEVNDGREETLINVERAPGVKHLSPPERALCSQLQMLPRDYLVVKRSMFQECIKAGCLKKSDIGGLGNLDKPRQKKNDFFSTTGW
ncbi:unnamed protein product [Pylaiella littoralis]